MPTSSLKARSMSDVLITVVVPAYNVAEFILPCLASVVAQTHSNWHCVVVDDGSGDDTAARVRSVDDNRITLLRQANAGVSAARNRGLAHARGDHVMFLDGDDVLHDRALARLAAVLANRPRAVAAYGTFLKILPDGTPYPGQKPLARHRYADGDVLETMLRGNFLANGGHVLIRTTAARSIGGFDTAIRLSEDWEFWCRLAACGEFAFAGNEPEIFSLRMSIASASGGRRSSAPTVRIAWMPSQPNRRSANASRGNVGAA